MKRHYNGKFFKQVTPPRSFNKEKTNHDIFLTIVYFIIVYYLRSLLTLNNTKTQPKQFLNTFFLKDTCEKLFSTSTNFRIAL